MWLYVGGPFGFSFFLSERKERELPLLFMGLLGIVWVVEYYGRSSDKKVKMIANVNDTIILMQQMDLLIALKA